MTTAFRSALHSVKKAIVHDNCPDGMASAIFIHDAMPDVEIQFVQYGTDAQKALVPAPGVMFCDISPYAETVEVPSSTPGGKPTRTLTTLGRSQVQAWIDAGALLLDHHKTVKEIGMADMFLGADQAVFGDEETEPGVCGAVLAFREIWEPAKGGDTDTRTFFARRFATLAGIRDTWQNKDPQWKKACVQAEMLRFYPADTWLNRPDFFQTAIEWYEERTRVAEMLVEKHERAVKKTMDKAFRFTTPKGTRVAVFMGTHLSSDVAEAFGADMDLSVGFSYEVENGKQKLLCSNRSRGTFDCASYAASLGGGGHTNAAGCNRVLVAGTLNPYEHIQSLVEGFEAAT